MNASGCSRIPNELFYWITFLAQALPLRSIGTFIELLIGAMLTPSGFVTDAYLIIDMTNHWSSYYKWLQKGRWSWLELSRQFVRLVLQVIQVEDIDLVIDDTLTLRSSKKAPGSQIHHQHGNKPNLAAYVRGQCWVSLAMIVRRSHGSEFTALPMLSRLIPSASNTGKLVAARVLIRCMHHLFNGIKVHILVDSWYMRRPFIEPMLAKGFDVLGQVRIDTRLYDEPPTRKPGQRGRTRIYGDKYLPERVRRLRANVTTLKLYGKEQVVRYKTKLVLAKFLGGRKVRAVWCEFQDKQGHWKSPCLLLSTDIELSAEQVIERYARRWTIETMFNQLKLSWGLRQAWQQTRQTLHRWVHLTSIGYGLIQLLSCIHSPEVNTLCEHSPWRKTHPVTAGQIRKGLEKHFRHVAVRRWWDKKCKKFRPPNWAENEKNTMRRSKVA